MSSKIYSPQESRTRGVITNALANFAARLSSILLQLLSVPVLLDGIGKEQYGIWVTLGVIVAIVQFADLGAGSFLVNEVATGAAKRDLAYVRRAVSSAYAVICAGMLIAFIVFVCIGIFFPLDEFLGLNGLYRGAVDIQVVVVVMFVLTLLGVPFGAVQRVQQGMQQGYRAAIWQTCSNVMMLIGVYLIAWQKGEIFAVALCFCGIPFLVSCANTFSYFMKRDAISPSMRCFSMASSRNVLAKGCMFMILQITYLLAFQIDNLLVSSKLGFSAVAGFAIHSKIFSIVTSLLGMFLASMWPAFSAAAASNDHDWIRRSLIRSMFAAALLGVLFGVGIYFAKPLLDMFWLKGGVHIDPSLVILFTLFVVVEGVGNCFSVYLNSINHLRFQVLLSVSFVVVSLVAKFYLMDVYGVNGVIMATVICYVVMILPSYVLIARKLIVFGRL